MVQNGHFLKLDNLNKEIKMLSITSQENIHLTSDTSILLSNLHLIPNIIRGTTSKVILA